MSVTLRIARSPVGGTLASLAVRWSPLRRLLRLDVLAESPSFVAFTHPRPQYPTHVLIVSTTGVRDFLGLDDTGFAEVLALADQLAPDGEAELVTNLGRYQEVRLLHFHVIPRSADRAAHHGAVEASPPSALAEVQAKAARCLETAGACRVFLAREPAQGPWRMSAT